MGYGPRSHSRIGRKRCGLHGPRRARIGERPMLFETPKFESIDIDTPEDWDFAVAAGAYLLGSPNVRQRFGAIRSGDGNGASAGAQQRG